MFLFNILNTSSILKWGTVLIPGIVIFLYLILYKLQKKLNDEKLLKESEVFNKINGFSKQKKKRRYFLSDKEMMVRKDFMKNQFKESGIVPIKVLNVYYCTQYGSTKVRSLTF